MVHADYGFGKTHLELLCMEELLRKNIPYVNDNIDGRSGSLAHIHRCVPRWHAWAQR